VVKVETLKNIKVNRENNKNITSYFNLSKGIQERYTKRDDIPDLTKITKEQTRKTIFKFINR